MHNESILTSIKQLYLIDLLQNQSSSFVCLFFKLTAILAIVEDTGSAAASSEERQRRCHQPVNYTALPWAECKATGCR